MPLQKQLYQTLAADSAIEKSLIKFDSKDPILFAQQTAYLHGQINILLHLVALSEEREVAEVKRPNQQSQSVVVLKPSEE